MAIHRATLPVILSAAVLLATAASAAEATTSVADTTASTAGTVQTMQQVEGKNLLWLTGTMTTCPQGTTLTTIKTASGLKKACVSDKPASSGSTDPALANTTPQ